MHTWSQNLNEYAGKVVGSKLWHGRGHVSRTPYRGATLGLEWLLFHKCGWRFGISFETGHGDGDDGFMLALQLPWLFAIYLYIDGVHRVKEAREFEFSIHHNTIWFYPWRKVNETNCSDPWWVQGVNWAFPWEKAWVETRVLNFEGNTVWQDDFFLSKMRQKGRPNPGEGPDSIFRLHEARQEIETRVSKEFPYRYVLKNGQVQERTATIHVTEMAWGMRWLMLPIWRRRFIDVDFNQEVGERTGSWKGGVLGCSYDMLPSETPEQCLRRMESDRKFK